MQNGLRKRVNNMDRMRFIFEDVIRHAKLKGHLDMTDVRRLSEIGIPITTLCIKNTPIDNIEKYVDGELEETVFSKEIVTKKPVKEIKKDIESEK